MRAYPLSPQLLPHSGGRGDLAGVVAIEHSEGEEAESEDLEEAELGGGGGVVGVADEDVGAELVGDVAADEAGRAEEAGGGDEGVEVVG